MAVPAYCTTNPPAYDTHLVLAELILDGQTSPVPTRDAVQADVAALLPYASECVYVRGVYNDMGGTTTVELSVTTGVGDAAASEDASGEAALSEDASSEAALRDLSAETVGMLPVASVRIITPEPPECDYLRSTQYGLHAIIKGAVMIVKDSRQYELRVTKKPSDAVLFNTTTGYTKEARTVAVGANDVKLEELESQGNPLDVAAEQGQLMLEPETEYQLMARARNVRGWTGWGHAANCTTLPVPSPPYDPLPLISGLVAIFVALFVLALCAYKFNCSEMLRACMVRLAKFRKKKDELDPTIINEFIGETIAGEELDPELVHNPVMMHAIKKQKEDKAREAAALKRMGIKGGKGGRGAAGAIAKLGIGRSTKIECQKPKEEASDNVQVQDFLADSGIAESKGKRVKTANVPAI